MVCDAQASSYQFVVVSYDLLGKLQAGPHQVGPLVICRTSPWTPTSCLSCTFTLAFPCTCTYTTCHSRTACCAAATPLTPAAQATFQVVVLDESHYIKNGTVSEQNPHSACFCMAAPLLLCPRSTCSLQPLGIAVHCAASGRERNGCGAVSHRCGCAMPAACDPPATARVKVISSLDTPSDGVRRLLLHEPYLRMLLAADGAREAGGGAGDGGAAGSTAERHPRPQPPQGALHAGKLQSRELLSSYLGFRI